MSSRAAVRVQELKEMTWQDVERLDKKNTVVMIACGPVEQHGPQTPLGTDLYIAEYVMHRCAEHLADHGYPVVIASTVPYVNALFSLPYPGSVSIRRKVVEEYLLDLLASFAADGFRHLVLTSQHVDPPPTGPRRASASASTKSMTRGPFTASSASSWTSWQIPRSSARPGSTLGEKPTLALSRLRPCSTFKNGW